MTAATTIARDFDQRRATLKSQLDQLDTAEQRAKATAAIGEQRSILLEQLEALDAERHQVADADRIAQEKALAARRAAITQRYAEAVATVEEAREAEDVARDAYLAAAHQRQLFESARDMVAADAVANAAIDWPAADSSTVAAWRRLETAIVEVLDTMPQALFPIERADVHAKLPPSIGNSIGAILRQLAGQSPRMTPDLLAAAQRAADELLYVQSLTAVAAPAGAALHSLAQLVARDQPIYEVIPPMPSDTVFNLIAGQLAAVDGGRAIVAEIIRSVNAQVAANGGAV